MKPIESSILTKLAEQFTPQVLNVVNESHMHSVPVNSETHFKVTLVSDTFIDLSQVRRHQAVYGVLRDELQGGVHALALHTFSASEWAEQNQVPDSPNCLGKGQ